MKKHEFIALCEALSRRHLSYEIGSRLYREQRIPQPMHLNPRRFGEELTLDSFYASWATGGITGASSFGSQAKSFQCEPGDMRLTGFDEFVAEYFPELTYLQYKTLEEQIELGGFEEGDHYGNCTLYAFKKLKFEDLWSLYEDYLDGQLDKKMDLELSGG